MKYTKLFAFATAFLMLAVTGVVVVESGSSDATATNGTVQVYVVDGYSQNGINISKTVDAYDGAIALDSALNSALATPIAHVMDMRTSYYDIIGYDPITFEPIYSSYPTINTAYGAITSISGVSAQTISGVDYSWHVYYLNSSGHWASATETLGFYKPFADYNTNFQAANIAVYYGTDSAAESYRAGLSETPVVDVVQTSEIVNNVNFRVSFYFKVNMTTEMQTYMDDNHIEFTVSGCSFSADDLSTGVTVYGYGSDLYTALKQVVGSNVNGEEGVPGTTYTYGQYSSYHTYSWLNYLFGVNSFQLDGQDTPSNYDDDVWAWWTEYKSHTALGDASSIVSDYVLGYFSPLSGAPNTDAHYAFVFSAGGM